MDRPGRNTQDFENVEMISKDYYQSALLNSLDGFSHGFSRRHHGDMRKPENRARFASLLALDPGRVVKPKQIHGSVITWLNGDKNVKDDKSDGLATRSDVPLSIIAADCSPILAVDPKSGVVGVAHAGWMGTRDGIAVNLVRQMVDHGAAAKEIRVAIGPCIGLSCYNVSPDRAALFREKFGLRSGVTKKIGSDWHIDIARANVLQLQKAGIRRSHIDVLSICTKCNPQDLFSYRGDADGAYGEIVGMIGARKIV